MPPSACVSVSRMLPLEGSKMPRRLWRGEFRFPATHHRPLRYGMTP